MDKFYDIIKNLKEVDLTEGLHGKIMFGVVFEKFKNRIMMVFSLMSLINLLISGFHIVAQFAENEFVGTVKALFDGFELNYDFISTFASTIFYYLPANSFLIFAVNIIFIWFLFQKRSSLRLTV